MANLWESPWACIAYCIYSTYCCGILVILVAETTVIPLLHAAKLDLFHTWLCGRCIGL